jgi:hypothetical protein
MSVKELKTFKETIIQKLKATIENLISGPTVSVNVSDDLERLYVSMLTERKNQDATISFTENNFIFDIKTANNIVFQGSNKTMVYKDNKLSGILTDNVQIDLITLYTIQQTIYNFAQANELIDLDSKEMAATVDNNQ